MDSLERGAALESQIGDYFRASGYAADQNVVLEGKSGGHHEIDVLAEKSDGIISVRVAVECKAWQQRVSKDVVSKLAMVMADLGINKGIVVALNGWHQGAKLAADSFGIDLWGPDDLQGKLGALSLAEVKGSGRQTAVDALILPSVPVERLQAALASKGQGFMGLGAEQVEAGRLVWLPFHLMKLSQARSVAELFRRAQVKVVPTWNLYSALDDTLWQVFTAEPQIEAVDVAAAVPPSTTPRGLARRIADSTRKWNEVVTDKARERYAQQLSQLGIATPIRHVTIDSTRLVAHPFFVGRLSRGGRHRFVAIDAATGKADDGVSQGLTKATALVTAALHRAGQG